MANGETTKPETDLSMDRTSGGFNDAQHKSSSSGQTGKVLVLVLAIIALIFIGIWIWRQLTDNVAANPVLQVSGVQMDKQIVKADGIDFTLARITLLRDNLPANDVWVGLKIKDTLQVTNEFDYFGWYAAEPNRSFYKADQDGVATIAIKSSVVGNIAYEIYAADPQRKSQQGDYVDLNFSFPITFE